MLLSGAVLDVRGQRGSAPPIRAQHANHLWIEPEPELEHPRLGDLDLRFSLSQLCRLVGGEVIASPGLQASLPLGFNLLIHDVSESPPLLNDWALHILEL